MNRKKIIVFAGGWGGEYLQETLSGIAEAAVIEDVDIYSFVNFTVHTDTPIINTADINFFKLPNISKFDGAILLANSFNSIDELDYLVSEIKKANLPAISVEYDIPGFSCISTNNFSGMYDLVSHIIRSHNAQTLTFIGGPESHPESQERLRAFIEACANNGIQIPKDHILFSDWSKVSIPPLLDSWLSDHELPDALICANDIMAMAACDHIRDLGYSVPENIMVTGFDCISEAQLYNPPVTSVNHEWHSMGTNAFKQLFKLMNHEEIEQKTIQNTRFVTGGTCGCPISPIHNCSNKEFLHRGLTSNQMDSLSIDSHFRHFYNAVRKAITSEDLHNGFSYLFVHNHIIEGNEFELYLDPEFFNITDDNSNLMIHGHPDNYIRVCAIKDNEALPLEIIPKEEAIFAAPKKANSANYYVFVPVYSEQFTFGFAVLNGALNAANENQYYIWTRHLIQSLEQVRSNITISKLYEKMRILSETDPLTGTYNRSGCQEKAYPRMIEHTKNGGTSVVMLVDVDRMKLINDQFGHAAGDQALVTVTQILKDTLPFGYAVTRFGGDEFLITGCLDDPNQNLDTMIDHVELSLKEYITKNGIKFPLTVSIGYAKVKPYDISDIEKSIIISDENMYQRKKVHHQQQ